MTGDFYVVDNLKRPGLGYSFIDVGLGACIVYWIVARLLALEKRGVWKDVQDDLLSPIKKELDGIVRDLVALLGLHPTSQQFENTGRPKAEWVEWSTREMLSRLAKYKERKIEDVEEDLVDLDREPDLVKNYLLSFERRRSNLRDLTFWASLGNGEILTPEMLKLIISLEQDITSLTEEVRGWLNPQLGSLESDPYVRDIYIKGTCKSLQALTAKVSSAIERHLIGAPPNPPFLPSPQFVEELP